MKLSDLEDLKNPKPLLLRYLEVLGINKKAASRILGCSASSITQYCNGETKTPYSAISTLRLLVYMREMGMLEEGLKIVHGLGDFEIKSPVNFG